jgi:hypothetical protein
MKTEVQLDMSTSSIKHCRRALIQTGAAPMRQSGELVCEPRDRTESTDRSYTNERRRDEGINHRFTRRRFVSSTFRLQVAPLAATGALISLDRCHRLVIFRVSRPNEARTSHSPPTNDTLTSTPRDENGKQLVGFRLLSNGSLLLSLRLTPAARYIL